PVPRSRSPHFEDVTVNHIPLRMSVQTSDLGDRARLLGPNTPASGQVTLLVARSLVDEHRTLDELRFILIAGSAVSLAVAAIAGWLLARNALLPIARLTDEA